MTEFGDIVSHNLSEQEVNECDYCDIRPECWDDDNRINNANWCMKDECE